MNILMSNIQALGFNWHMMKSSHASFCSIHTLCFTFYLCDFSKKELANPTCSLQAYLILTKPIFKFPSKFKLKSPWNLTISCDLTFQMCEKGIWWAKISKPTTLFTFGMRICEVGFLTFFHPDKSEKEVRQNGNVWWWY